MELWVHGTATCKIIGLYESPSNSFAQMLFVEVLINEHILKLQQVYKGE